MNQELKALVELQAVDKEILSLREKIRVTPLKVSEAESPLFEAKARLEAKKKLLDDFSKKKKAGDRELDEITDRINKLKTRTSEVKTNKEYQAHLKEIETVEKEKFRIEDEILTYMEQAEDLGKETRLTEDQVKAEEKKIEEYKKTLADEAAELEKELNIRKQKRSQAVAGISRDAYEEYMKQLENGQGLAVVEVRDDVCLGCNMNIPPQLYVEVRKGEMILNCPQCGRILFFPDKKDS